MNIREAIVGRRQVKTFKPDAVDRAKLETWLETASFAPNHRMNQPWEIVVIGPDTRARLNHKANFGDAPVVLAFLSMPAKTEADRDENVIAVSTFIQNFNLAAHADGAGIRWTSIAARPEAREILGVEDGWDIVAVVGVGYPSESGMEKPRAPIAEKMREMP